MIVDSSALLAVILGEEDGARMAEAMVDAPCCRISAANWLEAAIVVDNRRNPGASDRFDDLLQALRVEVVPFDARHAALARAAHLRFGKGPKAKLNFGDCMAYALAKASGEPLLFKGGDFARTDVEPALKD